MKLKLLSLKYMNSYHWFKNYFTNIYTVNLHQTMIKCKIILTKTNLDIDECLIPPTNETCGIRGTCRNTVGFYTCDCLAGYEVANETTAPTCAG